MTENIKGRKITPTTVSKITCCHASIYVWCEIEILGNHIQLYQFIFSFVTMKACTHSWPSPSSRQTLIYLLPSMIGPHHCLSLVRGSQIVVISMLDLLMQLSVPNMYTDYFCHFILQCFSLSIDLIPQGLMTILFPMIRQC